MKETYGNVLESTPTRNQKRIRETIASIITSYRSTAFVFLVHIIVPFGCDGCGSLTIRYTMLFLAINHYVHNVVVSHLISKVDEKVWNRIVIWHDTHIHTHSSHILLLVEPECSSKWEEGTRIIVLSIMANNICIFCCESGSDLFHACACWSMALLLRTRICILLQKI